MIMCIRTVSWTDDVRLLLLLLLFLLISSLTCDLTPPIITVKSTLPGLTATGQGQVSWVDEVIRAGTDS